MIIQAVLTEEEEQALVFILGFGTGAILREFGEQHLAKTMVRLTNKLLANNPNYVPYDPDSLDNKRQTFPFNTVKTQ